MLCVWVHGCDPGRLSDGSRLVLYKTLYNIECPSPIFFPGMRVCVFSSLSFWTSSSLDVPAGVTQEEGHTADFSSTFFLRCVP